MNIPNKLNGRPVSKRILINVIRQKTEGIFKYISSFKYQVCVIDSENAAGFQCFKFPFLIKQSLKAS